MNRELDEQLENSQAMNRVLLDICKHQNKKIKQLIAINVVQIILFILVVIFLIR